MRRRSLARWRAWWPGLLLLAACVFILRAWLSPANIASWLALVSFCA